MLVELELVNWSPKLNSSLLRDQNLREFLSLLTFPVYNINNFDDLSISISSNDNRYSKWKRSYFR